MLLHHEGWWLALYFAATIALTVFAIASSWAIWMILLIAIGGAIVSFYGWLFQVGRFG